MKASPAFAGLVVHQERVLADIGDVDDLERAVRPEDNATISLGSEADRLAVLEWDQHVGVNVLAGHLFERAVVEDVAVLVDLDERRAVVRVGVPEHLLHVLAVHVVRATRRRRPQRRSRARSG